MSDKVILLVKGNSMSPAVREGDIVIGRRCRPDELSEGDLVIYKNKGLTLHRLICLRGKGDSLLCITKGDASLFTDRPWPAKNLVGKVVGLKDGSSRLYIAQSGLFRKESDEILSAVEASGIRTLLIKGPAVDSLIYNNDYLRPRADLDLVVKDEDAPALEKVFLAEGYSRRAGDQSYPVFEHTNSSFLVRDGGRGVSVHIHRHLMNNIYLTADNYLRMEMDMVWRETLPFKDYLNILTLKPEMQLLHLFDHGLKHNYESPVYLYEIDALMRHYKETFDWNKLTAMARESGLGRILYWGLYLAERVMSSPAPQTALEALKPTHISSGERNFVAGVLKSGPARRSSFPVYLAMREGLAKKAVFGFRMLFPPGMTLPGLYLRLKKLA